MKRNTSIEPLETRIAPAVVFAVEVDTNKLVSFDSAAPNTLLSEVTITGLSAGQVASGIDFDPATGKLMALGVLDNGADRTASLYFLDPVTGAATSASNLSLGGVGDTGSFGFEINPLTGIAHLIDSVDGNHTISTSGSVANATTIADPNQGEAITAIAYDRSFGSTKTTLYGYNFSTDELVTIGDLDGSPQDYQSGVVNPIAKAKLAGVNITTSNSSALGFDIAGPFGGPDQGWIALNRAANGMHLYNIDLATAALTDLGAISTGGRLFSSIAVQLDAPAPVISTDGKTATWRDLDGDNVTVKITKGALTAANFRMLQGANETSVLSKLTLADPAFTGTNITITAKPGAGGGDGRVNVGTIDATGVDIGAVTVAGDLLAIDAGTDTAPAPSLKSLTVASMGTFGLGLLSGKENTKSTFADGAGKIVIAGDFHGFFNLGKHKTGSITIGGDVIGGTEAGRGGMANLTGTSTLGKLTIKGSIRTEDGSGAGQFLLQGVGAVVIGGDIVGGVTDNSANLSIDGTGKTTVTIGGSVIGNSGGFSGALSLKQLGSLKIGGSVIGSTGIASALIAVSGTPAIAIKGSIISGDGSNSAGLTGFNAGTFVKTLTIGGSIVSNGEDLKLQVQRFGKIAIRGSVVGLDGGSVTIIGIGLPAPASAAESIAIGSITIGGSLKNAIIGAGVNANLTGNTADAAIGAVKIGGNMIASSITAGIIPMNGIFGDGDDQFVGGNNGNAAIIAKIASVTIGGQLLGTAGGAPDTFGILAEQIDALTIGKVKIPLTTGKDDLTLGFTADVRVREL